MNRIKSLSLIAAAILLTGLTACSKKEPSAQDKLTDLVDPFIGTDFHGHTFPGAATPGGMVQLSPDTRTLGWDACAGYHYSDSSIIGFSHTHLSGTGIGDYGDILFQPFSGIISINTGSAENIDKGFRSRFDRQTEEATPGYYKVKLSDYDILAELTATPRVGIHKYTFPKADEAGIIIDLTHTIHGHQNPHHEIIVVNDTEIRGFRETKGWATKHYVYFHAVFSKPFEAEIYANDQSINGIKEVKGENLKARLKFSTKKDEVVLAKVGISSVSYEGALLNLNTEAEGWDFESFRSEAQEMWEDELSCFQVESEDLSEKRTFYTALYHSMIYPGLYNDVDGKFRSMRQEILQSDDDNYTVFSLWDTHRALHPLFTIIRPDYNQALIRALIRKYEEGGILPMWELASNYTGTMIGSHAVSVIVDAYMKGQRDFDVEKALEASIDAMKYDSVSEISSPSEKSWSKLMPKSKLFEEKYGFIPCELEKASVSQALEFAYNYWAIATMARDLGEDDVAKDFFERSRRYKTYFDSGTGFMRGKRLDGSWDEPFHPRYSAHWNTPYVEGNAWQWTWYVPHDIDGLIQLMGGKDAFAIKLDSLFTTSSEVLGEEKSADITGLIGQYAHGNEPSHHIAYMYNNVDMPWRTQEVVTQILNEFYSDQPDGLVGNEDCGQMSAWYILNTLGFYPMCPGDTKYSIGLPRFETASIYLENGNIFKVEAENFRPENPYVQEVYLNDVKLQEPYIDHKDIETGGKLKFVMGIEKTIFWK
ncbi:GH92 family glycosyl hydrolase [Bacteroidota bacterium]